MKKARDKRLNIYNTDRYFNINLMKRDDIASKIKVTRLNEDEIEKDMDELASMSTHRMAMRDDNAYILFQEKYNNDRLVRKVLNHGGSVSYYTDTIVPYYILTELAKNPYSETVYAIKPEYSKREVENIQLGFMACEVAIDCPVVLPDVSPYDLLFALHPLKTNVDRVQVSFPWLTEEEIQPRHQRFYQKVNGHYEMLPKYKYEFFKYIQTSLSLWRMYIWLVCDSEQDYTAVDQYVQQEQTKRNANRERALHRKETAKDA